MLRIAMTDVAFRRGRRYARGGAPGSALLVPVPGGRVLPGPFSTGAAAAACRTAADAARSACIAALRRAPGAYWVHGPDDMGSSRRDPGHLAGGHGYRRGWPPPAQT